MKCSDFIAKFLKDNGIKITFDFTGGMIANIEDSISKTNGIACLPTRNEQGAGFAAEGFARISNNFGVAMATSGPGATNMITAIASCYFDSVPVLFLTGQVNTKELKKNKTIRQNGFQELDIVDMVKNTTKYSKLILEKDNISYELEKALFFMKENRPGPVLLDIPFNIQTSEIDLNNLKHFFNSPEHRKLIKVKKNNINLNKIALLLKKSKSPIVLFGNGIKISKTKDKLINFLNNNNLPAVSSLLGLGELSNNQNNFLGFIGTYGNRSANIALANADLIIVLGSRLDLRQTGNPSLFANKSKIIHVDIDASSRKEDFNDYLFIECNLNVFFDQLKNLKTIKKDKWFKFLKFVNKNFIEEYHDDTKFCNPNLFFQYLSKISPTNSNIIADVGQNQMWLAQSWLIKNGQKLFFSGGMGAMGFSLPVAIGTYFFNPSRPAFAFMGDGGFQINIQELETIAHNNLPLKIFVLNNKSLGMVREFQDQYFNKNHQSTVIGYSCPNLKKIADAYNFKYEKINNSDNFLSLRNIIKSKKPTIIEVILSDKSKLTPKVVYGNTIENQAPFLSKDRSKLLNSVKDKFLN